MFGFSLNGLKKAKYRASNIVNKRFKSKTIDGWRLSFVCRLSYPELAYLILKHGITVLNFSKFSILKRIFFPSLLTLSTDERLSILHTDPTLLEDLRFWSSDFNIIMQLPLKLQNLSRLVKSRLKICVWKKLLRPMVNMKSCVWKRRWTMNR